MWGWLACLPNFIIIELLYRILRLLFIREGHKGVAPIVAIEVHHHSHFIDFANLQTERKVILIERFVGKVGCVQKRPAASLTTSHQSSTKSRAK